MNMSSNFTEQDLFNIDSSCSTCPLVDPTHSKESYPLKRGKACIVCRALKIKCDGVRPVCGSCQRKPKANKCDWDNYQNRSRVAILLETIKSLEARIFELEHPELVAPVTLHYPYRRDEEEWSTRLNVQAPFPVAAIPNFSSDNYWDTATNTSVSSTPSADSESLTGDPVEFDYPPTIPPGESALRYYAYRRGSESYASNSLSTALMQPRHT